MKLEESESYNWPRLGMFNDLYWYDDFTIWLLNSDFLGKKIEI